MFGIRFLGNILSAGFGFPVSWDFCQTVDLHKLCIWPRLHLQSVAVGAAGRAEYLRNSNKSEVEKETRAELSTTSLLMLLLCCIPDVRKVLDFAKEPKTNQGIIAKALRNPNYLPWFCYENVLNTEDAKHEDVQRKGWIYFNIGMNGIFNECMCKWLLKRFNITLI